RARLCADPPCGDGSRRRRLDRALFRRIRSRGQADRGRFRWLLHGLAPCARWPSRSRLRRGRALGGSEGAVRPEARLYRVLLSAAGVPDLLAARARALLLSARSVARGDRPRLLSRPALLFAVARASGVLRLSRRVHERRPRAEWFSQRGADRRRAADDGPE